MQKKIIINILKYVIIYVIILGILLSALCISSKIPKEKIEDNIKQSAEFYKKNRGIKQYLPKKEYSYAHYYADSVLLNIIYNIDTSKPLESVMWDNYYENAKMDINNDFIDTATKGEKANEQYLRYWHGSMIFLRPLLVFFNIGQIYTINKILLYTLAIILFILLFRKNKKLSIIYLVALAAIAFPMVPYTIEYSTTFYLMLITSIIALKIEKKSDKSLFCLFFITGMLTCFFDFFTTEIITIMVPILLVLAVRKSDDRLTNFKDGFYFTLKSGIMWLIAYASMWLTKWGLASIILNINALDYVKDEALYRINGEVGKNKIKMYTDTLYKNFHNLYPINNQKRASKVWIYTGLFFAFIISIIDWKNIKKKWFSFLMLLIGITPYIRYLVLANHSYRHAFFTFREQIITIIAFGLIILDSFNYDVFLKEVEFKKNGKRINNTNTSTK